MAKTTSLYFGSDELATGNETVYLPLILRSHRYNSNEESRFRKMREESSIAQLNQMRSKDHEVSSVASTQ